MDDDLALCEAADELASKLATRRDGAKAMVVNPDAALTDRMLAYITLYVLDSVAEKIALATAH